MEGSQELNRLGQSTRMVHRTGLAPRKSHRSKTGQHQNLGRRTNKGTAGIEVI